MVVEHDLMRGAASWQVESLRLTAFPVTGTAIPRPSWWADLVGKPPDVRSERPSQLAYQDEGLFQERKLALAVQPSRIDWYLTLPDQAEPSAELPSVGSFPDSIQIFRPLLERWVTLCPPLQRLAFGTILLQSALDRIAANKLLSKYLPMVRLDPEHSSDFSYRINRPRVSRADIAGLKINRLSRWSAVLHATRQLDFSGKAVQTFSAGELHAVHLELDINTPGDFQGELPRERLPEILDELISLGLEIAAKGEIA